MQDAPKAVWSIPYVSLAAFFPSLKQNFIAYRSSKVSSRTDCIFEIPQLWQSGFSRLYSNCCCSCSLEPEIITISQSSHKMYSNDIVNFQESTTILNACTKNVWKLIEGTTYQCDKYVRTFTRELNGQQSQKEVKKTKIISVHFLWFMFLSTPFSSLDLTSVNLS